MKKLIFILLFLLSILQGFAQLNAIKFEQLDSLQKIQNRKIIVFIHTDWCQFCQAMQSKTFKNKAIIKDLNENFYFIAFNAEDRKAIAFNNQIFRFKPTGNNSGIHELAITLGTINNQVSYPVLCVLNTKNEIVFQHNNSLNTKDFKHILEELKE